MSKWCVRLRILITTLILLIPTLAAGDETVSFAVGDWPPYVMEQDERGIATQLVEAAMTAVERPCTYEYYPWKRSLYLVANAQTEGSFPWRKTPEREQDSLFSNVLLKSRAALFFIDPAFSDVRYENLEKHPALSVGGVLGYWYHDDLKSRGIAVDMSMTSKEAFRKLLAKRIDVLPEDEYVGWAHIRANYPDMAHEFRTTHIPGTTALHVIFPRTPEGKALCDEFNRGLAIIRANGTYDRIVKAAKPQP